MRNIDTDLEKKVFQALFRQRASITVDDFRSAFNAVVDNLTQFKKDLRKQVEETLSNLKDGNDGHTPTPAELKAIITPLIPKVKDGETPTNKQLLGLIKPLIPDPLHGSADTGEEVVDKINDDKSGKVIKKEHVEGLKELEDLAEMANANARSAMSFGGGGSFNYNYDLSSLLDGVTKTFTLPANARVLLVIGSSFPVIFRPTIDYTTTASTITFTSEITASTTLAVGQTVIILYKIL